MEEFYKKIECGDMRYVIYNSEYNMISASSQDLGSSCILGKIQLKDFCQLLSVLLSKGWKIAEEALTQKSVILSK